MMKFEVQTIGYSTGLILPEELLEELNLSRGDWLLATQNVDGSLRLSFLDPAFENGMEIAEGG